MMRMRPLLFLILSRILIPPWKVGSLEDTQIHTTGMHAMCLCCKREGHTRNGDTRDTRHPQPKVGCVIRGGGGKRTNTDYIPREAVREVIRTLCMHSLFSAAVVVGMVGRLDSMSRTWVVILLAPMNELPSPSSFV